MNLSYSLMLRYYKRFNKAKMRYRNIKLGRNPSMYGPFHLRKANNSKFEIGDNFLLKSGKCINPLSRDIKTALVVQPEASSKIGNNVGISGSCIWVFSSITIGNNVLIGGDSIFMDSNAHSISYLDRRDPILDAKNRVDEPILIEDDVLIGSRCFILKGVTIGARSVIAAGSIVTKSIPPDSIAGGNPCKVIKNNIN